MAKDDADCLARIRQRFRQLPEPCPQGASGDLPARVGDQPTQPGDPPQKDPADLYGVLPADHRLPYDIEEVLFRIFDGGAFAEFQPEYAPEMLCADMRLAGRPVAVLANRRGFLRTRDGARIGGIIYTGTARKAAYFVEAAERLRHPLIYLQDVSGFMVGPEAEREGIIRAGAEMVEAMSCATVPRIVLTLNHASGAGYYAMAGQGFDPNFTFSWPTARIGVMEGESAVQALYAAELAKYEGSAIPEELRKAIEKTRADYERWLDARYAAARGHCDALIDPLESRAVLSFALEASTSQPGPQPAATGVTL